MLLWTYFLVVDDLEVLYLKYIYFPCVHLHFLVKQGDRGKRGRSKKCQSGAPGTPGHRGENVRHTALASLHSFLRAHL